MRGIDKARELRILQTDAEAKLWRHLRDRRLGGRKFRRQHPIGPFVVDFVCADAKLIVELDGGQHGEQVRYDDARTAWLRARGYVVRRYWNDRVIQDMEGVLEDIRMHLSATIAIAPHPDPLPARGERERNAMVGAVAPHPSPPLQGAPSLASDGRSSGSEHARRNPALAPAHGERE